MEKGAGRKMKALTALVVAAVLGTGAYLNQPTTEIISYQKQVEEGDTLWDICKEISKDEVDVRLLVWQAMKDNNISDCGALRPGTVITVNVERARQR
jgi:transcriptional accessory protein Tex/SPT6